MMEQEILTEIPQDLKRLIRLVVRGFYAIEHSIVIDMLVRNPCMKEDDIQELLKFDRKQLRSALNSLKNDKFLKVRMRVETDPEGRTSRHNYYFINYQVFVNVVKYKLDHVRRKIEMEERDNTSRASFKCDPCQKTFTDLEADQLFDFMSQTFSCTICGGEVQEDESSIPTTDARTLLAKFNEQIQPIYELLRKTEDLKLSPELMEPEPTDISKLNSRNRGSNRPSDGERTTWSGDATRNKSFGYTENTVTISMNKEENSEKEAPKEQPVWMKKSTVEGASMDTMDAASERPVESSVSETDQEKRPGVNHEIEKLLMIHEKKSSSIQPVIPGASNASDDSDSSDSDMEVSRPQPTTTAAEEEIESDVEEEDVMVTIAGEKVPLHDVTDDMVTRMSVEEKSEYIRISKELYEDMYE